MKHSVCVVYSPFPVAMSWPFSSVHAQLQPHWLCPSPLLSVHSDHSRMSSFPKQLCHCPSSPSQAVIVSHCFPGLPQQPVLTSVISWMTLFCNNCWQPIANCTRSCWRARALPKHLDICRVPPGAWHIAVKRCITFFFLILTLLETLQRDMSWSLPLQICN